MGSSVRRPDTYSTTPITASEERLETSSITMIFDWMLNLARRRGPRRQPVFAGTVCSCGAGSAEPCGVNQRPFPAGPKSPDHAAEYRLASGENGFAENRYQHDVCVDERFSLASAL